MKKYMYTVLAGVYLCSPMALMAMEELPNVPKDKSQVGVYMGACGLLALAGAVAASVQKYGKRFTKAAVAAGITGAVTWNFMNKAAIGKSLEYLAKAVSVELLRSSIIDITPAAIIGSFCCGSLAFCAIYAYFYEDDYYYTHKTKVTTQTDWQ